MLSAHFLDYSKGDHHIIDYSTVALDTCMCHKCDAKVNYSVHSRETGDKMAATARTLFTGGLTGCLSSIT